MDHVGRWRENGEWKSRFPDQFVAKNKRIMWEFWFNEDRTDGEGMQQLVAADRLGSEFVSYFLPHVVPDYRFDEFGERKPLPEEWLRENLSGVWQYSLIGKKLNFFFEFPEDAFHFKLVHYEPPLDQED